LIVALLIWRNGGGWAAGVASFFGVFGLAYALHDLVTRNVQTAALREEIRAVRQAQAIFIDQIEALDKRLTEVVETVTDHALRRSEELSSEVHMLEDAVARMSQKLEYQLSTEVAAHRPDPRRSDQSRALLDTVRDALSANRVDLYLQPV